MSDNSHIQWTSATWNVVTGCTRVSPGCDNCYIPRTPPFRMAHRNFDMPGIGGTTGVLLHPDRLTLPLSWRKPRRVFVNSLSDLAHEAVPDEFIAKVFAVMAATPQHTYQILTKRPARLRALLGSEVFADRLQVEFLDLTVNRFPHLARDRWSYPLPNVWLGVSTENQEWAEKRIPILLQTPAAVRFISAEPLGPIDLMNLRARNGALIDALGGDVKTSAGEVYCGAPSVLDWVIVGGESGPGARPMDSVWAMDLVIQCQARVPFRPVFVKQLGSVWARENGATDRKGGDLDEWPLGLRERQFPRALEAAAA